MNNIYDPKKLPNELTADRKREVIEVIQALTSLAKDDFDEYIKNVDPNKYWQIIIDFYTLPKSDLHKEFETEILNKRKDIKIQEQDKQEKLKFIQIRKHAQSNNQWDFYILNKFKLATWDQMITIWVPYYNHTLKKTRFNYTQIVSKNYSPKFYEFITDNFTIYQD